MKNAKILTVLGVLLAMGVAACGAKTNPSGGSSSVAPAGDTSSKEQGGGSSSDVTPPPAPEVEPITAHTWGTDADVEADAVKPLAPYKKALCTDNEGADKFMRLTVNQAAVSYSAGSTRKNGTPDGYTKLTSDGQSFYFNFNLDTYAKGKLYFFGRMDGWSTSANQSAGFYRNGNPSIKVELNGDEVDISAQKNKSYLDYFGSHDNETDMDSPSNHLSDEGFVPVGPVVLKKGVNEFKYTRVQTQNMIIKDFVFVVEPIEEWGPAQDVAGETGYVSYKKYESNIDDSIKLEIRALDGTFGEGQANKDGTEEGYLKLNSKNDTMTWKFKYDSAAVGQLHQIGFMDAFGSNHDVLYSWTSTSGNHAPTFEGNLRATINNNKIDRSPYMNIRAEDLTKNGDNTVFPESKNYSPLTLLPVGGIVLNNGDNTIVYERLGSYNYVVSTLVLIVKNSTTPLVVEDTLSADDGAHFNKVTGTDVRFNAAAHTLEADSSKTDVPATCSAEGKQFKKCSVCNHEIEIKVEKLPHTWVADDSKTDIPATETTEGTHYIKCSECGEKSSEVINKTGHTFVEGEKTGDITALECSGCHEVGMQFNGMANNTIGNNSGALSSGKINKAVTMTWNLTMPKAGKVTVAINAKCSAGNEDKAFTNGWAIKGGATAETVAAGTLTLNVNARADTVLNKDTYVYLEIGNVEVAAAGAYVIQVTTYGNSAPARLLSDGLVRVYY